MLTRSLRISVAKDTFPGNRIPSALSSVPPSIDAGSALLLLGTLAVPGGFSSASPARYWAWLRYLSAITSDSDLRISEDYADLDPHQKTILSDDFGVAFGCYWLCRQLGNVTHIIDGRRFVVQYSALSAKRVSGKPSKVGNSKCPDFVIRDAAGIWHVLECKGTQSGTGYRATQLRKAVTQKQMIDIRPPLKGLQLVSGLSLAGPDPDMHSSLLIHDPEPDPLVKISKRHLSLADRASRRLSAARALGMAGAASLATELSVPDMYGDFADGFLYAGEQRRLARPFSERFHDAQKLGVPSDMTDLDDGDLWGRSTVLQLPSTAPLSKHNGIERVRVQVGVERSMIDRVLSTNSAAKAVDDELASINFGVSFSTLNDGVALTDGLLVARMKFE